MFESYLTFSIVPCRVLIEKYGDEYDVSKSAVRNLHPKELKEKPFKYPKPVETKTEDSSSLHDRDMNKVSSSHPSSCHSSSTKAQSSSKVVKDEPEQSIIVGWIRPGIKVKLVSKKYGDHLYLHKGYIVDVLSKGFATVKLENGCMVDSIAEKHLETSLPTIGGNCMVIYGEHRGEIAILMQKHKEMAVIQLAESYEMVQLSLDWVAGVLIDN